MKIFNKRLKQSAPAFTNQADKPKEITAAEFSARWEKAKQSAAEVKKTAPTIHKMAMEQHADRIPAAPAVIPRATPTAASFTMPTAAAIAAEMVKIQAAQAQDKLAQYEALTGTEKRQFLAKHGVEIQSLAKARDAKTKIKA